MKTSEPSIEPLFAMAEELVRQGGRHPFLDRETIDRQVEGLVPRATVEHCFAELQSMPIADYIARAVSPSENPRRPSARAILLSLLGETVRVIDRGPLYAAEMELRLAGGSRRRIGIIAQERTAANGVWMPAHHREAGALCRSFAACKLPIVTLIDTPGADASEQANRGNQAHSISYLIAEMAQIDVPVVAVVIGNGYSGGAIPLASANILLSVRDGIFNTIQPRGLASIARKQGLSWQECARMVGVSAYELCHQGYIDGVIDYAPNEPPDNFIRALVSAITCVEESAITFTAEYRACIEHYTRSVDRFVQPSAVIRKMRELSPLSSSTSPTSYLNVFGAVFRFTRHLAMRRKLRFISRDRYAPLCEAERPAPSAQKQRADEPGAFEKWIETPLAVRYNAELAAAWNTYLLRIKKLNEPHRAVSRLVFGDRQLSYLRALDRLTLVCGFHLYNLWKQDAPANLRALSAWLEARTASGETPRADASITDVLLEPAVRNNFFDLVDNLVVFDSVFEAVIRNMPILARTALNDTEIPRETLQELISAALKDAAGALRGVEQERTEERFFAWLEQLRGAPQRATWLRRMQEWKLLMHPRLAPPLLAIATFVFETLLPEYALSRGNAHEYKGRISPRNIGMRDFWDRLVKAYQDLLIGEALAAARKNAPVTTSMIRDEFFAEFTEFDADLMTSDPAHFPGFRQSIEQSLDKGITPCGIVTGTGTLKTGAHRVGVIISNAEFQAGAFDMASAEKFCRLLERCARAGMPVVCFISSGGMQTKEGAGALFSMPVINDRLTRFILDHELPVICFGFGDCTGGAQASFVTHPLVQTYYFSGTNMPFAGQVVVPQHLPLSATLSNYLSQVDGAMRGLVTHPFLKDIDGKLRAIDPDIPVAQASAAEVIEHAIRWNMLPAPAAGTESFDEDEALCRPYTSVLIHSRGCTCAKLIERAKARGLDVILVQSDADMTSFAAGLLKERDRLVCLGGNTPSESYLNAMSVVRIAQRERAGALHPGIGFLSENPDFAALVRRRGIVFVGPRSTSMARMGNKSNAILTARQLAIPVVPGSHGVVTGAAAAAEIAESIRYPVILKAVYGGGGKGIGIARDEAGLREKFATVSAEALSAFGNGDVYLEKCIVSLRHVEVQLLRDRGGNTVVLGLRDCSVQRNNQKLIEESGSTMLPESLREAAFRQAAAIADAIDYIGAGTVEFIYDLETSSLYFMEMNTRLQIEHMVTELVSGVAIVDAQYEIAAGGSISGIKAEETGYAIEVRVNADRPVRGADGTLAFSPNAGTVTECVLPERAEVTLLSAIQSGSVISPYYDSMIVQVIVHGKDRADTISKLEEYLSGVRIEGVYTNLALLRAILRDEVFRGGKYDTTYLPRFIARLDADKLLEETERAAALAPRTLIREKIEISGSDELRVLAPQAGIFYRAVSPSEPDLVREGDHISIDRPFGLLEVMKTFITLSLDSFNREGEKLYAGGEYEVVRISAANARQVNPGDLLLVVKPLLK